MDALRRLPPAMLLAAVALLGSAATAAAQPTWTEVASGTTETITAIEYQGDDRFWFATSNGKIFRREGGAFVQRHSSPGLVLNDIEARGTTVIAVGNGGKLLRSINGGATFGEVLLPQSNGANCANNGTTPVGDLGKIAWAGETTVFAFGAEDQSLRSTNGGATWTNHNFKGGSPACFVDAEGPITGAFFTPGIAYLHSTYFGEAFADPAATSLTSAQDRDSQVNGVGTKRLAGDPANPSRQWVLTVGTDGNTSYFRRTEDGWTTKSTWTIGNPARRRPDGLYDIAYGGGTVLAAGAKGGIQSSVDGRTFFHVDAGGALAAQEWRAVGIADGTKAAVGGVDGKLVLTANANAIPDVVAPTGRIVGPDRVTAGQPAAFTSEVADDAGGSGIDPGGFAWSVEGLGAQSGATATFTFPNPGTRTVKLGFRDRAGNVAEVTRTVEVVPAVPPAPGPGTRTPTQPALPTFSFPAATRSPVSARRAGRFVVIRVSGRFAPPSGVPAARACRGSVVMTVLRGRRLLTARTARLGRTCRYTKTIRVPRASLRGARSVKVRIRFQGNTVLRAAQRTYTARIRR